MKKLILVFSIVVLFIGYNKSWAYDKDNKEVNSSKYTDKINVQIENDDIVTEEVVKVIEEFTEEEYYKNYIKNYNKIGLYSEYEGAREDIYNGLKALKDEIDLTKYCNNVDNTDFDKLTSYYFDTLVEYPEIFYGKKSVKLEYLYYPSTGKISKCTLKVFYIVEKSEINSMILKLNNKVNYIKNKYLNNISDNLQFQYIIHDYILENTSYDYNLYEDDTISATSYGAIVEGKAICEGYSKAAKLLLDLVGIESGVIRAPEIDHAWNYVNIEGEYYHMDITWEEMNPDSNRSIYRYFNVSDDTIAKNHSWQKDIYPSCTSNKFEFLRENISDNITRVKDRLYYFNDNNLYSINLYGNDIKKEYEGANGKCLVSFGNEIFFVDSESELKTIVKYNIDSKRIKEVKRVEEIISNIYTKNGILYIETATTKYQIDILRKNNGWVLNNNKWSYYIDGELYIGWLLYNNKWYYLKDNGEMAIGWVKDSGTWYYMSNSGAMQTGWIKINKQWYYLNKNGSMKTRWFNENGKWYYLNEDGDMAVGWIKVKEKWYYMNETGVMKTGWVKYRDKWYYLKNSGEMATKWIEINGKWYYMDGSGAMEIGWLKYKDKWYYLKNSGEMATGWIKINGKWYNMGTSGAMQ